jgi:glycosyltransferase involved in cell wall biosynthesis
MRVAVLTPLPPAKTGVAHYASLLLPALGQEVDLRAFSSTEGYRRQDFDHVVYQLGNNPHHEWIYAEAMREPGVIVLHDLVLHHLIVEMTLARGDAEGYVNALQASHGEAGAAWARGRAAGLHSEMGNFLLPASVDAANRSRAVIVHNNYAAERLRSFGVTTPIEIVPHPYVPDTTSHDRDATRARLGIARDQRVIGLFGFLTSAKRAEVVLEAFRVAREKEPRLVLLIVGEPAPNIELEAIRSEGVITTGYVADEEFGAYYAAADRLVNLRYPSAGETSGTLIRAFDAGKPVAVSEYAQFAEFANDCVFKVPFGDGEVARLVEFFLRDLDMRDAQRAWLEANARLDLTVAGYLRALGEPVSPWAGGPVADRPADPLTGRPTHRVNATLPLFAHITLVATRNENDRLVLTLRSDGETTLRTRTYGEPEFRLIAQFVDGERVLFDRWLALPGELRPGATTELSIPRFDGTLRLFHAIQDVPAVEVTRVR